LTSLTLSKVRHLLVLRFQSSRGAWLSLRVPFIVV